MIMQYSFSSVLKQIVNENPRKSWHITEQIYDFTQL